MDGPCFHRARGAIECAKAWRTYIEVGTKGQEEAFRIYALLYSGFRSQWTPRQRQVFDLSISGKAGKKIATQLGITPSAVSQHLGAAGAKIVFDATEFWVDAIARAYGSLE
jgi:DNA-binding NarL/FixJ family response regulator